MAGAETLATNLGVGEEGNGRRSATVATIQSHWQLGGSWKSPVPLCVLLPQVLSYLVISLVVVSKGDLTFKRGQVLFALLPSTKALEKRGQL